MADTLSDIAKNASSMSVSELGSSLLGRKEANQKAQNKRDKKDARIAQVLGVLTAGQGLFKNSFKRRQKELANIKTLDLLNNEADAKEISNISSIINVIPKDFTKAIDPATGLPYTVAQNTSRFFENPATAEAITDKLSPIIDQQIKFSADANMAIDNPSKYQVVKERAAQEIFKNMITGDKHITFLEGLEELYVDKGFTREELIQQGIGVTPGSLNSLKTSRYAKMERELQDRPGLFNPKTYLNIFKGIGKDKAEQGELNIFQSLTEKDLSAPKMTEVLETMNLKGIVIPAFDKAMAQARLSPDRYLAKVRSPKFENQRANMSDVVLLNLNAEIDKGKSFQKYGLQKYIDDGTMDDMAEHITGTDAVKFTFQTRAVGLSERLKYDKSFAMTLYKEANPNATPLQLAEFAEDIKTTEFRNKFSALAVLKAGIVDKPFSTEEEWAPASTALAARDISKVSQSQFDREFEEAYGVSAANMADKIDPLISPMFKKTGEVTPEYHALPSNAGKTIAYDMQVNMVMNSQLNEQQKGERLEKFFNITPNPRGAPDVESYIVAMQKDIASVRGVELQRSGINLSFTQNMRLNNLDQKIKQSKSFLNSSRDTASKTQLDTAQNNIVEYTNEINLILGNPENESSPALNKPERLAQEIKELKFTLETSKDNLVPSEINRIEKKIIQTTKELEEYNYTEETSEEEIVIEDGQVNPALLEPRKVGKDLALDAINLVTSLSKKESPEYVENMRDFLDGLVNNESEYGTNKNTFSNPLSNARGPFQIKDGTIGDDANLIGYYGDVIDVLSRDTGRGASVRAYNEQLKAELGIDLATAKPEDLDKMLYGAAFARAGLLLVDPPIPTDPKGKAYYYADYYHKGKNRDKIARAYLRKNKELFALSSSYIDSLVGGTKSLLAGDE